MAVRAFIPAPVEQQTDPSGRGGRVPSAVHRPVRPGRLPRVFAIVMGLIAAAGYGASDFVAGLGSRRSSAVAVALLTAAAALAAAVVALTFFAGSGPSVHALAWGAFAGIGGAVGTLALFRGLAVGRMSVVAPVAGMVGAALPVVAGLGLGERLSVLQGVGIALAVPAILLISSARDEDPSKRTGIREGILAGAGFALVFIALDRAGSGSGAWPFVATQVVSFSLLGTLAIARRGKGLGIRRALAPATLAGLLGGAAVLVYVVATSKGQLSIVAVIASLYPAVTIVLARLIIHERWTRTQVAGLLAAVLAVAVISAG